jgi:hypothetical protein
MAEAGTHAEDVARSVPASRVSGPGPDLAAPSAPALSAAGLLGLQRSAGNAAVGRLLGGRPLQRDAKKPPKSVRKGDRCEPGRTISGTVFVPFRDKEVALAQRAVDGSTKALAKQNITLDLDVKPFLELDYLNMTKEDESRTVDSYAQVCLMLGQLNPLRTKPGIVVLVVPISGEICANHGMACYVPDMGDRCGVPGVPSKVIILGTFMAEDQVPQVLAHELGHHAGVPPRSEPNGSHWGHEEHDPHNYMGYNPDRDHYRPELLERMCQVSFRW